MPSNRPWSSSILESLNSDLPLLISSVDQEDFGGRLLDFLRKVTHTDHLCVFNLKGLKGDSPVGVSTASIDGNDYANEQMSIYMENQWWRYDPTFPKARLELSKSKCATLRTDIAGLDDTLREMVFRRRGIRDRALVCFRTDETAIGLSICSSNNGFFTDEDFETIGMISPTLFAILAKHVGSFSRSSVANALTSREQIEACILEQMPDMPRREREVCSLILFGVSTVGISLELGIGVETVMTYRKRAYDRLSIATQRELIVWYLNLWSGWPRRRAVQLH